MPVTRTFLLFTTAALLWPSAGRAQSLERSIERWAESIAANAERLAAKLERKANLIARDIEREFDEKYDSRRSPSRRSRDRWEEGHGRDLQDQSTRIDTTIAFSANGIIDLTTLGVDIVVNGWDRREVRVLATVDRGRMDFELSSSRVTIEQRSDRGSSARSRSSESRYELTVPRGVRVITRSNSGDITIRGTGGDAQANSNSGDIAIEDVSGRVDVSALSGEITLRQIKGNVDANAVSGSIDATGVEGNLHLGSTSGDLIVVDAKARDVELSTSSGEVAFAGTIDPNGRYEFSSHSGTIDLSIPAGTNARFSVGTFSGEIDSDFPITLMPGDRTTGKSSRRFEFTVGSGGPRIVAESFSGDVEIRKR
jgi:DUF4097 and DUF4098 domain-containing protein YvlB